MEVHPPLSSPSSRHTASMTIPSPPDPDYPDDEARARIARCDPREVRTFFAQLVGPVRAKLASLGLSADEYRDLANEVLLEAVQKIGNYDRAKGRFITWLLTIAKRRGIDYQQKRGWIKEGDRYVPRELSLEAIADSARRRRAAKESPSADEEVVVRFLTERQASTDEERTGGEESIPTTRVQQAIAVFQGWLEARPEVDRIAAQGLLYGTPWAEVAKDLSRLRNKKVDANAAKQHGDRLKKRVERELAYLFDPADHAEASEGEGRANSPIDMEGVR
jgi:DNA-directed RNA polymerase specialized sigma24 family protein